MKAIRTFIAAADPETRKSLRNQILSDQGLSVIGESANGRDTITGTSFLRPELLILDLDMPGTEGLKVLESIRGHRLPALILLSNDGSNSLQGFDEDAIDFVLKPFGSDRLKKALDRAKRWLSQESEISRPVSHTQFAHHLVVKSKGKIFVIRFREISHVESFGNYVRMHVGKEILQIRTTIGAFEAFLDPNRFIRIHRSFIVNMEHIKEIEPAHRGDYVVRLNNGAGLSLSRSYRNNVRRWIGE
jgi:two-component system LytT family response regulator